MAPGSGVSAAGAPVSEPSSRSSDRETFSGNRMVLTLPRQCSGTNRSRVFYRSGHRLGEVFRDLVEETGGGQPALFGADQQRKILGHEAGLDSVDADLLQRQRELLQ